VTTAPALTPHISSERQLQSRMADLATLSGIGSCRSVRRRQPSEPPWPPRDRQPATCGAPRFERVECREPIVHRRTPPWSGSAEATARCCRYSPRMASHGFRDLRLLTLVSRRLPATSWHRSAHTRRVTAVRRQQPEARRKIDRNCRVTTGALKPPVSLSNSTFRQ
jgi:hypothetical protein